jgi:hypothetical protein
MLSVTGTIVRAGTMMVDDERLDGIFIECSKPNIKAVSEIGLYNKRVYVFPDRRRGPRPKWETPEEVKR